MPSCDVAKSCAALLAAFCNEPLATSPAAFFTFCAHSELATSLAISFPLSTRFRASLLPQSGPSLLPSFVPFTAVTPLSTLTPPWNGNAACAGHAGAAVSSASAAPAATSATRAFDWTAELSPWQLSKVASG